MFFLGAAFMLLETRSLVTFALLFGSTWLVNSLVFFAILCSVLLAVLLQRAASSCAGRGRLYALLFALLLLNYVDAAAIAAGIGSPTLRYRWPACSRSRRSSLANVVFSRSFRDTSRPTARSPRTCSGIAVGGMVEYAALATGYQALLLLVMAFYAAALLFGRRLIRRGA